MVGWHHRLNGHEFEQVLGDGEGQGSLACCSPWSHKESDTIKQLSNNQMDKWKPSWPTAGGIKRTAQDTVGSAFLRLTGFVFLESLSQINQDGAFVSPKPQFTIKHNIYRESKQLYWGKLQLRHSGPQGTIFGRWDACMWSELWRGVSWGQAYEDVGCYGSWKVKEKTQRSHSP